MDIDLSTGTRPDYLERAGILLEALLDKWTKRGATINSPESRAEVLRAQLGIIRGLAELAAVQRGVPLYASPARPEPGQETP